MGRAITRMEQPISRRRWMVGAATPVAVAALVGGRAVAATGGLPGAMKSYGIREFGAVGDGKTLDSKAVQAAIDQCARDGGGTVVVPAGDFMVGTMELKSNVTLHLEAK